MTAVATVDHDLCTGTGQCLIEAPGAFSFDGDGLGVFTGHDDWTSDEVEKAAEACPMAAIKITSG